MLFSNNIAFQCSILLFKIKLKCWFYFFILRFNWTDGKLNSSNLIELSGQITENFDEEFRILYAQSLPFNTRMVPSVQNSSFWLTSTPNRAQTKQLEKEKKIESIPISVTLNLEKEYIEQETGHNPPAAAENTQNLENFNVSASTLNIANKTHSAACCHIATQTSYMNFDDSVQIKAISTSHDSCASGNKTCSPSHSFASTTTTSRGCSSQVEVQHCPYIHYSIVPTGSKLRDCVCKLTKERHYHFSIIRSKLDHMMRMLSDGRQQVDLAGRHHGVKDSVLVGTWPRSKCLQWREH